MQRRKVPCALALFHCFGAAPAWGVVRHQVRPQRPDLLSLQHFKAALCPPPLSPLLLAAWQPTGSKGMCLQPGRAKYNTP